MTTIARIFLILAVAATIGLLFGLVLFAKWRERDALPSEKLEYSKLYFEAFKVITISFFVALTGILVPAHLREARYRFQVKKESRAAYSKAKTGVAYLPLQLSSLPFTEAANLIQQLHFEKHQAELYKDDLQGYVEHLGISGRQWGQIYMYDRLVAYRTVLEDHVADWDLLTHKERMEFLLEARAHDQEQKRDQMKKRELPRADIIG